MTRSSGTPARCDWLLLAVGERMLTLLRRVGVACRIGLHDDDAHNPGVGMSVVVCRLCGRWAALEARR